MIEVWEKSENVVKCEESEPQPAPQPQPEVVIESNKLENIRGIFKRRSTSRRKKVLSEKSQSDEKVVETVVCHQFRDES